MSRRLRDHIIMLAVAGVIVVLSAVGSANATFRSFFDWPSGATWSNMIASAEWLSLAALVTWYYRDNVGKSLSAWVHKHQAPHRDRTRQDIAAEIRQHVAAELESVRTHITDELAAHHERIVASINGNGGRADGG